MFRAHNIIIAGEPIMLLTTRCALVLGDAFHTISKSELSLDCSTHKKITISQLTSLAFCYLSILSYLCFWIFHCQPKNTDKTNQIVSKKVLNFVFSYLHRMTNNGDYVRNILLSVINNCSCNLIIYLHVDHFPSALQTLISEIYCFCNKIMELWSICFASIVYQLSMLFLTPGNTT